ncbi:rho GTPase-activating protein 18-like [Branchiostoma floridae]|uniref:Rho GTPase-activating protein 18-like n=2 Tax=Branchiostoma floridae TaxID=7739 RepID=A0A9J7KEV9_BRAFL|nr:rho GTPase-activating protein 18-like [Branchiostoma floridae]
MQRQLSQPGVVDNDLSDYWTEIKDIEENSESFGSEEDLCKTPDEFEHNTEWLKDSGLTGAASKLSAGNEVHNVYGEVDEVLMSTLTRTQAAAVERRVSNLNQTLRMKGRAQPRDVRDIFQPPSSPTSPTMPQEDAQRGAEGREIIPSPFLPQPREIIPSPPRSISPPLPSPLEDSRHPPVRRRVSSSSSINLGVTDAATGVRTMSVQPKSPGTHKELSRRVSNQELVSDTDISLDFSSDAKLEVGAKSDDEYSADQLPNFTLVKDKYGVTKVGDLSERDMKKVRSLALIELTALFDTHNIELKRRRPGKVKLKESGVFSVPLEVLVEQDQKKRDGIKTPLILQSIILFLEENALNIEGILRVPGSAARIKNLRKDIEERFNNGDFTWDRVRPNDVAALLKQFLRELPNPLLTYEYLSAFASVEHIPDRRQQLQALNLLILLLPTVHRDSLKLLLKFLSKVVSKEKENKMNINNVAMIMAPNMFLVKSGSKNVNYNEVKMAAGTSQIVRMLIKYHKILWTVPSFMVMQVRRLYQVESSKTKDSKGLMKLIGRHHKEKKTTIPSAGQEDPLPKGVIKVVAPHLTKTAMVLDLDPQLTAGDVVKRFRGRTASQDNSSEPGNAPPGCINPRQSAVYARNNTYLYEKGGNIGERCLDMDTNIATLVKVNPHAEWVLKPKSH